MNEIETSENEGIDENNEPKSFVSIILQFIIDILKSLGKAGDNLKA